MARHLTLSVPDDAFSILRLPPEAFGRELRLAAAIKWYELGPLSQSKAAELAGMTRAAFLEALGRYEVSPFQVTPEELEEEFNRE